MLCKCHHTEQDAAAAASPGILYKWVSFVILHLQMLGMVGLPWGCESHMGKLQTAQCPLLVNTWTRRHSDLFPDWCPQGEPWAPADSLLIYSDLQRHTQESPKTPATISHMCIQKLDLNFNILYPQGFVDFFNLKFSFCLCTFYFNVLLSEFNVFNVIYIFLRLSAGLYHGLPACQDPPSLLQC